MVRKTETERLQEQALREAEEHERKAKLLRQALDSPWAKPASGLYARATRVAETCSRIKAPAEVQSCIATFRHKFYAVLEKEGLAVPKPEAITTGAADKVAAELAEFRAKAEAAEAKLRAAGIEPSGDLAADLSAMVERLARAEKASATMAARPPGGKGSKA